MSRPTNDQIMLQMHRAWMHVTVLDDKSYVNFQRIVDTCIGEIRKNLELGKASSTCSTGSVYVVGKTVDFDKENPYRYEIMITSTFCIEGC